MKYVIDFDFYLSLSLDERINAKSELLFWCDEAGFAYPPSFDKASNDGVRLVQG